MLVASLQDDKLTLWGEGMDPKSLAQLRRCGEKLRSLPASGQAKDRPLRVLVSGRGERRPSFGL